MGLGGRVYKTSATPSRPTPRRPWRHLRAIPSGGMLVMGTGTPAVTPGWRAVRPPSRRCIARHRSPQHLTRNPGAARLHAAAGFSVRVPSQHLDLPAPPSGPTPLDDHPSHVLRQLANGRPPPPLPAVTLAHGRDYLRRGDTEKTRPNSTLEATTPAHSGSATVSKDAHNESPQDHARHDPHPTGGARVAGGMELHVGTQTTQDVQRHPPDSGGCDHPQCARN